MDNDEEGHHLPGRVQDGPASKTVEIMGKAPSASYVVFVVGAQQFSVRYAMKVGFGLPQCCALPENDASLSV